MSGKFALIIGNTEYLDPGLAQLTAPGKDTEDFARILKDKDLCAFDEVKILLNQLSSTVIEAIDEFFDQKKPDDLLILYFSGHGVRDELGSLYLAVKNTIRTRLRSTAIKSDYIREVMDQSRSKRQVLIMDCCNSGAFSQGTKAATGVSIGTATAFEAGYGRMILTASDSTQFAWEGEKVIGETDNSLFTHYLVEGLEGEADLDGDGRITVDEVYDYAYEKVRLATPKQTPSKFSSKQQGEIVLRQFTRIEDIKPVSLPNELMEEIEDTRPYVREAAVQKLEKILKGRNIGLARSAREALEKITIDDNTTRRVAQMATQVLESVRQAEQKAEEERRVREEAERLAALKAEEERLVREKAETERKAKEEAEKLLQAQARREAAEREATRLKAEGEAAELAARQASQRAEKEAAEQEAVQKAEREAMELTSRRKFEREAAERAEREERTASPQGKTGSPQSFLQRQSILTWAIVGVTGLCVIATATWGISYIANLGSPNPTEKPSTIESTAAISISGSPSPTSSPVLSQPTETLQPSVSPQTEYALQFDGIDDFVAIVDMGDFDFNNNFSVEGWVKPVSLDGSSTFKAIAQGAFSEPPFTGSGWVFFLDSSNYSTWGLSVCVPECNAAYSGEGDLKINQWQHVTATYDGTEITIFRDGEEVSSTVWSGNVSDINFVLLGIWETAFDGLIDEVRIWDITLTQSQIQANMNRGISDSESGLVGYWMFNEGSGQTAFDSSNRHNDGRLGSSLVSDSNDPIWVTSDVPIK